jgi:hypothetical protein
MTRKPDPVLVAYDETEYGDLSWTDAPSGPGWYWFRVVPSTVVRGPARVLLIDGTLWAQAGPDGWYRKPCSEFQRRWAGPLDRPVPVESQA